MPYSTFACKTETVWYYEEVTKFPTRYALLQLFQGWISRRFKLQGKINENTSWSAVDKNNEKIMNYRVTIRRSTDCYGFIGTNPTQIK
jgi:hypothetical protein